MLKEILNKNPGLFPFLLRAATIYLAWIIIYKFYLLPQGRVDNFLIEHLVKSTDIGLRIQGFNTFNQHDLVGIDGTHGVHIGPPCNGLSLFVLFAGFIISYPGQAKKKLWFIPAGIIFIHFLNILRLIGLCLVVLYKPESLDFNHSYTFTIILYAIVFSMWMLWVKIAETKA